MLTPEDVDGFATKISEAIQSVVEDYAVGDAVHENPFSGQLTGRVKETLREFQTRTVRWQVDTASEDKGKARLRARQLTSQGAHTEESKVWSGHYFLPRRYLRRLQRKKGLFSSEQAARTGRTSRQRNSRRTSAAMLEDVGGYTCQHGVPIQHRRRPCRASYRCVCLDHLRHLQSSNIRHPNVVRRLRNMLVRRHVASSN